jgi:hypothetical protein
MTAKPAKSTPQAAKAVASADEQPARARKTAPAKPAPVSDATAAEPEQPTTAGAEAEGEGEGEVFLNRAQRRAKGRNPSQAQVSGRGKVSGGHGPAGAQRNWANRRSG